MAKDRKGVFSEGRDLKLFQWGVLGMTPTEVGGKIITMMFIIITHHSIISIITIIIEKLVCRHLVCWNFYLVHKGAVAGVFSWTQ